MSRYLGHLQKGDIIRCRDALGTPLVVGNDYVVRKLSRTGRLYLKGFHRMEFPRRIFTEVSE